MSNQDLNKALEASVAKVMMKNPFYGCLLQEISFKFNKEVPTGRLSYKPKNEQFSIELNPDWFLKQEPKFQQSILLHEVLHFTHNHILRTMDMNISKDEQKQMMLSQDVAINQYITHLPEGAVTVDFFKKYYDLELPRFQSMEEYFRIIKQSCENDPKLKDAVNNIPDYDEHEFGDGEDGKPLTPEEKQAMLGEMKNLITRTIEKTSYGHSLIPDQIKDLLKELDVQIGKMNYKQILASAIKKHITAADRTSTWNKPNKRYGVYSPGTKTGLLPNLFFGNDSSGSISYTEQCEYLQFIDGILKVGNKKCKLGLWHTNLYKVMNYKNKSSLQESDLESGGTDPVPVMKYIEKIKPDLSIVFTDGFFNLPQDLKFTQQLIWVVSKNGNTDTSHMAKYGRVIKMF